MARQVEYRYVLYDEGGVYVETVYGTSNKVVADYLRKRGWTGIGFSRIGPKFNGPLKARERASKVYGRDRNKKTRDHQFRHLYIARELWVMDMEYVPFQRPEFIGT